MTNKFYVQIMLNQEQIFIKVKDKYFAGFTNGRFDFTDDEKAAYQFTSKEEFIGVGVVLNAQYEKEAKLFHLVENKMEPLEIYNNFIKAEMQISADKWGEQFTQWFKDYIINTKFKIRFTVDGTKYWVKEAGANFIVKNMTDFHKIMTTNENESCEISIADFKERKEVSSKEVSNEVLDILTTTEFLPTTNTYNKYANEVFQTMLRKELYRQIEEEKESRKEEI